MMGNPKKVVADMMLAFIWVGFVVFNHLAGSLNGKNQVKRMGFDLCPNAVEQLWEAVDAGISGA